MTNQISTQTISFNNQSLVTFEQNGVRYTAMKPICDNIGLAWEAQLARIKRDDILSSTMIVMIIVAEDGKNREMVCLPIEYLNGWLFGIDVNRCKPEIRETLIKYKKECYQALHDYWFKGKAERTINPEQQQAIQEAVVKTHHRTGMSYAEIYRQLKSLFKVGKYDQLKPEQFEDAIGFLNNLKMPTLANELNEQDLLNIFEFFYCTKDFAESVDILLLALKHFDSTHQRSVSCRYDRVSRRLKLTLPAIEHIYQLLNGRHHSKVLIQN